MLIKIIKLFGALTPLEPRLGKKLIEPLTNLVRTFFFKCNSIFQYFQSESGLHEKCKCICSQLGLWFSIIVGIVLLSIYECDCTKPNNPKLYICLVDLQAWYPQSLMNLKVHLWLAECVIIIASARAIANDFSVVSTWNCVQLAFFLRIYTPF